MSEQLSTVLPNTLEVEQNLENEIMSKESPKILDHFFSELNEAQSAEKKLELSIAHMEKAISSEKAPDFKVFWEVRKVALPLFKDNISPLLRTELWKRFSELSKEARRLKEIFDEESNFAREQIEIAVTGIEKDIEDLKAGKKEFPPFQFSHICKSLLSKESFYQTLQEELTFLNLLALRISSLRKELIGIEIRIRLKNQLFDRLSQAGDAVFPRRKELIQEISASFTQDIEQFKNHYFGRAQSNEPIYVIRDEIKALQNVAKELTLNTQAFGETRLKLSECWDKLRAEENNRKKEYEQKKESFVKNAQELLEDLNAIKGSFESGENSIDVTQQKLDEISQKMRAVELGRDQVREIKEFISSVRKDLFQKKDAIELERKEKEKERLQKKNALLNAFSEKIDEFVAKAKELSSDEVILKKEELIQEIQGATLSKSEKESLEKRFKSLKEILRQKREESLLKLPADKRQALEQLQELLSEKQDEKIELKEQWEKYRKEASASGLDFRKAIEVQDLIREAKEKFERAEEELLEIESKIESLENSIDD